jgi:DNA-binding LacI/PurR family transcriptional regulator
LSSTKLKKSGKVGIRDVAEAAGVSTTAVSQALNGTGRLPEGTRSRLREVAERLGYHAHPGARSLVGAQIGVIGMAFSTCVEIPQPMTNFDYWNRAIHAATEAALARGFCLVIGPPTLQTNVWQRLSLDGVVILDPVIGDDVPAALRNQGVSLVVVGRDPNGEFDDPCVDNDHAAGTVLALDHLWERGARRIAMFGYSVLDSFIATCEENYRAWCAEREIEPSVVIFPPEWETDPRKVAAEVLSAPGRPDAVFCLEGDLGVESARAASDCGLDVPIDLMIVACSDERTFPDISLTTLELDPAETARQAVNLLLDLVEERPVAERSIEIPVRLVARASTDR